MSHTLRKTNLGNSAFCIVTIVDYAVGGEAFTLAELGLTGSLQNIYFIRSDVFPAQQPLYPVFQGGKVVLSMSDTSQTGDVREMPATTGLNFNFLALVQGT